MTNKYFSKSYKGDNRWWVFLVVTIIVFLATQLGSLPIGIVAAAKAMTSGTELTSENLTNFTLLGINQNLGLFLVSLPFVFGLISLLVSIRLFHGKKITDTLTGRKSFDFKRFFFAMAIWGGLMVISLIISYYSNPDNYVFQFDAQKFIVLFFISATFITMQASFEEIAFRGYYMQGLATLFKNAWVPLIITSVIFGAMHMSNPEVKEFGVAIMLPQYILLGLLFAICVVMDEGLEMAIGLHVVNNVLGSLLLTHESSVLQTPAMFQVKEIDPVYSLFELLLCSAIFIVIMHKKYNWGSFKKIFVSVKPEHN